MCNLFVLIFLDKVNTYHLKEETFFESMIALFGQNIFVLKGDAFGSSVTLLVVSVNLTQRNRCARSYVVTVCSQTM